ncbi:MAG: hypothetical protein AAGA86_07795 [Bacteroidota bacterium]
MNISNTGNSLPRWRFPRKRSQFSLLLLALLLVSPIPCAAQSKKDLSSYYNLFDSIIGIENLEIHYGEVYVEKHRTKSKKTKFFPSPNFMLGSVVFNGLPYYSVNLKYNVYEDELLMKIANRLGGEILQVYKDKVNSFAMGNHSFVKIEPRKTSNKTIESGFYEILLELTVSDLYKKHRKRLTDTLGENLIFYEFEDLSPEFVVYSRSDYHKVQRIMDLKGIFPEYTEQLGNFVKTLPPDSSFEDHLKTTLIFINTLIAPEKDNPIME